MALDDSELRARAKSLLEDLHSLYGGAGTFTVEQLDGYAVDVIVKWATEEKRHAQSQDKQEPVASSSSEESPGNDQGSALE